MNATFAKNEMSQIMPAGVSYRSAIDDIPRVANDAQRETGRGLGRRIADAIAYVVSLPRRQAVLNELSTMTDRELADIGVARSDMRRVFDPAFAQDRALRGKGRGLTLGV